MKDSTKVEVMVSEQEKYGCVGLFRGWKRGIQELDLQDLIHMGLDEYNEKCRRKMQELLMWVTAALRLYCSLLDTKELNYLVFV